MKKVIISTFILAISSTAYGEYFHDDVLNFSDTDNAASAGLNAPVAFSSSFRGDALSEYFNDDILNFDDGGSNVVLARDGRNETLSAPPAVGSSEVPDILDHLFPDGNID